MSDLLRRIKRPRRTPAADPASGSAAPGSVETPPETSPSAGGPLLAGEDVADPRPTTLRRGRLRKRLRFLERERELLLRDLGGLVYEIHRTGTARDREQHRTLVASKVARLGQLDAELESGLAALGETRGDTVLREPGIGGLCPRCGEIHGSDARFCSACGFPLEVIATPGATVGVSAGAADAIVPAAAVAAGTGPARASAGQATADPPIPPGGADARPVPTRTTAVETARVEPPAGRSDPSSPDSRTEPEPVVSPDAAAVEAPTRISAPSRAGADGDAGGAPAEPERR